MPLPRAGERFTVIRGGRYREGTILAVFTDLSNRWVAAVEVSPTEFFVVQLTRAEQPQLPLMASRF